MKVGSAVLGLHIVAVVAFSLTQGCVTTEGQSTGSGSAAGHKGPWRHQHKGKVASSQSTTTEYVGTDYTGSGDSIIEESVIVGTTDLGGGSEYVPPVTPTTDTETYIVQKGDILGRIAIKFDTTVQTLVDLNNLDNKDVLFVGQKLIVPAGRGSSSTGTSSAPKSTPTVKKGAEYTIQKGDTLSGIAAAADVSINDLRALNNIEGDKIIAGETISIPAGGKVPTKTQKTEAPKVESAPQEVEVEQPPELEPEVDAPAPSGSTMDVVSVEEHVVYPGETLESIAREYAVTKSEIMRLNNITNEADVKTGMRLRIPVAE